MVARPAPARALSAEAVEFVTFCYERRKVGWPELYDEMCGVAARGLFRDWGPEDLEANGIAFTLDAMPTLAGVVTEVVTEARAADARGRVATRAAAASPA